MWRVVPPSLIAIHFVGLPAGGAFVKVPALAPEPFVSALVVVIKDAPPSTVKIPACVNDPTVVHVIVLPAGPLAAVSNRMPPRLTRTRDAKSDTMYLYEPETVVACSLYPMDG